MTLTAQLYQTVYLLFALFLTYIVMQQYSMKRLEQDEKSQYRNREGLYSVIILTIVITIFIGLRPIDRAFVDMFDYAENYKYFLGDIYEFTWNFDNFLFDNLFAWMCSMRFDVSLFFLLIAIIYFGGIAWASMKMFPNDTLLAFVMYLGAFSTFSYGTNGIKAGAAASIFLVALAYRNNLKVCIPLLWVSLGFHHSMLAPIVAFVMAYFVRKPKWFLYGWLFCLILAAAHITFLMNLFAEFIDEHGAEYLVSGVENAVEKVSGFRPDFIIYSSVPIIFGYYMIINKNIQSEYYSFLWRTYTLTNCVFLLCTYGTFINRIAYLSWLMYPFVLLYPVINIQWSNKRFQFKLLKRVVWWHLLFTLFMDFIYYGFLHG